MVIWLNKSNMKLMMNYIQDIVGSAAPSIYDSKASLVSNEGKNVIIYVWYDNEYGYSHQVVRL